MEDPAIARFREMLARDPRSMAFAPLAEALRKSGRLDEAVAAAEAGLKTHPGYLGGLVVLGRALFDKGDIPRAFDILSKAVKANPDNYMAAKTLARIHLLRGEAGLALTAFRTVRSLMPGDREVEEELARLEAAGVQPAEPPPPPPPPPAAAAAPQPVSPREIPGIFEFPEEEKAPPPPSTRTAAEVPANPFAPDEEVHSLLGDVGGDLGGDGEEAGGAPAPSSFFDELPLGEGEIPPAEAVLDVPPAASEPAFATGTLARLYAEQGANDEARRILKVMGRDPVNEAPSGETGPVEAPVAGPAGAPAAVRPAGPPPGEISRGGDKGRSDLIAALERWLAGAERMRRR